MKNEPESKPESTPEVPENGKPENGKPEGMKSKPSKKKKADDGPPATPKGTVDKPTPNMKKPNEDWKKHVPPELAAAPGAPTDPYAASVERFRLLVNSPLGKAVCNKNVRMVAVYLYGGTGVANGDPDNGGRCRIDPASGKALVSPESLGAKQRAYWEACNIDASGKAPVGLLNYQSREVANSIHRRMYREMGRPVAARRPFTIPKEVDPLLRPEKPGVRAAGPFGPLGIAGSSAPSGTFSFDDSGDKPLLFFTRDLTVEEKDTLTAEVKDKFAGDDPATAAAREWLLETVIKTTGLDRQIDRSEAEEVGRYLCTQHADVRRRGGVFSSKINCSQYTAPLTLTMGWSVASVQGLEQDVVNTPRRIVSEDDQGKKDREMGSRAFVGHTLYRSEVYYDVGQGRKTDLNCFDLFQWWESLGIAGNVSMWDKDRRGYRVIQPYGLVVFVYPNELGNSPAESLLARVSVEPRLAPTTDSPKDPASPPKRVVPNCEGDYTGTINLKDLPPGVIVARLLWRWDQDGKIVSAGDAPTLLPAAIVAP